MKKAKAIYARQSKDKKDSLSIDAQVERCMKSLEPDEPHEVFIDRGISGKNTDRPQFKKLLEKIKNDEFSGVVVYKLDRFSRSLLDFMSIYETLEKHDVKFISCNEHFDTSTPMGRAMLALTAVFAQMERETIVERCKDTYYQRAEKGFYAGGRVPFGYNKIPVIKDGFKTSMLEKEPLQADIVERIYKYYTEDLLTFSSILNELNSENPSKPFHIEQIKYILRNGVYVKSDESVYDYLKTVGAVIKSDFSEFNGTKGFFAYGDPKKRKGKKLNSFSRENITIGLHEGFIDSETWLKSQYKLDGIKTYKRAGTSSHTWLSGLTYCGYCGHALTFSRGGNKKSVRYYATCGGRKDKYCLARTKTVHADELERIVEREILKYLDTLPQVHAKKNKKEKSELKALENKLLNLSFREDEIRNIAMEYTKNGFHNLLRNLDNELSDIESQKSALQNEIQQIESVINTVKISECEIKSYAQRFSEADMETKKKIAGLFIDKIVSTDDEIEICYKV